MPGLEIKKKQSYKKKVKTVVPFKALLLINLTNLGLICAGLYVFDLSLVARKGRIIFLSLCFKSSHCNSNLDQFMP